MRTWQKLVLLIIVLVAVPLFFIENRYFKQQAQIKEIKTTQASVLRRYNQHTQDNYAVFNIYVDQKAHGKIYYFVPKNQQNQPVDLRQHEIKLGETLYQKALKDNTDLHNLTVYVTYNSHNLQGDTYAIEPTAAAYGRVKISSDLVYQKLNHQTGSELIYDLSDQTKPVSFKDLQKDSHTLPMIKQLAIDQLLSQNHYTVDQMHAVQQLNYPTTTDNIKFNYSRSGLTLYLAKNSLDIDQVTLPISQVGPYLNPQLVEAGHTASQPKKLKNSIALTFNTGLTPKMIAKITKVLAAADVKATFFPTGSAAKKHPDQIKQLVTAGQALGTQTYEATDTPGSMTSAQLTTNLAKTDDAFYTTTSQLPRLLRVPLGNVNATVSQASQRALVEWSVDSEDWRTDTSAAQIRKTVLERVTGGDIVLLHTSAQTIEALPQLITELQAKGYHLTTVPGLFNHQIMPGYQYFEVGDKRAIA